MKLTFGLLMVGVSAVALAGCHTSSNNGPFNAILGEGSLYTSGPDAGKTETASDASADKQTTATVSYDGNNTDTLADDTVTVSVKNGGQVAGPRGYVLDQSNELADADNGLYNDPDIYSFGVFKPVDAPNNSILVAGIGDDSYAGFVGTNDTTTGAGNIAAAFGGTVPTNEPTTSDPIYYHGDASAVAQKVGERSSFVSGSADIAANFSDGSLSGEFDFDRNVPDDLNATPYVGTLSPTNDIVVGFTGTMSSDGATYSSDAVAVNGVPGTGTVQGGFFGAGYLETAGAIDVQDSSIGDANVGKITGSYIAHTPLP